MTSISLKSLKVYIILVVLYANVEEFFFILITVPKLSGGTKLKKMFFEKFLLIFICTINSEKCRHH